MFKKISIGLMLAVVLFLPLRAVAETPIKGIYQKVPGYEFKYDSRTVRVVIEEKIPRCKDCLQRWHS